MSGLMMFENREIGRNDIEAILAALPLVMITKNVDVIQQEINGSFCVSAANKLREMIETKRRMDFRINEVRVMFAAVEAANVLLSGGMADNLIEIREIDDQWKKELEKNFFAYRKLANLFEKMLEPYMNDLS